MPAPLLNYESFVLSSRIAQDGSSAIILYHHLISQYPNTFLHTFSLILHQKTFYIYNIKITSKCHGHSQSLRSSLNLFKISSNLVSYQRSSLLILWSDSLRILCLFDL